MQRIHFSIVLLLFSVSSYSADENTNERRPVTPPSKHPQLVPQVGHASSVTAIAFTRDANRVVTCSWDGTVRIWDSKTLELLRVLTQERQGLLGSQRRNVASKRAQGINGQSVSKKDRLMTQPWLCQKTLLLSSSGQPQGQSAGPRCEDPSTLCVSRSSSSL